MHKTLLLVGTLASLSLGVAQKPRVAICGLAIESSTFSPATTDEAAFHASAGQAILANYSLLLGAAHPLRDRAESFGPCRDTRCLAVRSTRDAYESLMRKMLEALREQFAARRAVLRHPRGDERRGHGGRRGRHQFSRIRALVGPKTLISTSMDLHGNVPRRLAAQSDLITCYRMAPHEDEWSPSSGPSRTCSPGSKRERPAGHRSVHRSAGVVAPGAEQHRIEPARAALRRHPGHHETARSHRAAIWIGYAWADEPRNHAAVMVTGDDQAAVKAAADSWPPPSGRRARGSTSSRRPCRTTRRWMAR